jgi:NTE family protein
LGTSAGSWAGGSLRLGVRWKDAIEALGPKIPRLPDPRTGRLRRLAAELFGEERAAGLRAVVCSVPRMRRTVLDGADYPLADIVAASSAVPGLLAPHKVGSHRFVDGGVRSMVSADLAEPADHLLVVAPIAGPMFGPAGRIAERILRREMDQWRANTPGGQLWLIRPNRSIASIAWRPGQLFSTDRAKRAYDLSYAQGTGIFARWTEAYGRNNGAAYGRSSTLSTPSARESNRR